MLSIGCLLLLGVTAISQAQELITAQTLMSDIKGIDAGVNALTASLIAYNGDIVSETPIAGDIAAIHLANRKGFADANLRATPFNTTDTIKIVDYTTDSVGYDIPRSVDILMTKKPDFEATGQDPVILAGLQLLLNDHDTFSAALLSKTTGDEVAGDAVVKKIHDSIQGGIDYYSSQTMSSRTRGCV
ncbi:hypothetical protein LTR85_005860 [Meristemomyces frigidus]|nr:hypothetical protein LTR85_005860 [Meristemomyces frigidus]